MSTNGTPAYGRRLIPKVLDELAQIDPDRVYAAIPKTSDVKDGYHDVSVAELARCADFMAMWLEDRFGRSDSSETITYIGLAPIDWVPVDTVANMLQSFSLRPAREEPQIYDIVYEKAQPWNLLVDAVREWIGNSEVQVISLQDWVDKLRNISDPSPQDVANLPALKLLDFYETLGNGADYMRYATGHAKEVSGIEIPAIDKELLASGLESWNL